MTDQSKDRELFEAWHKAQHTSYSSEWMWKAETIEARSWKAGMEAARAIDRAEIERLTENCNFLHDKNQRLDKLLHERDDQLAAALSVIEQLRLLLGKLEYNELGVKRSPSEEEVNAALALSPDLSALREHDAKVLESFLRNLFVVMDSESKEGKWQVILDYDNYQDGARILNGDGEIVGECYDLDKSPDEQVVEAVRRVGSVKGAQLRAKGGE